MKYRLGYSFACKVLVICALGLASRTAAAGCVKVRGADWNLTCMDFSEAEISVAKQYGLRLGSSYRTVRRTLAKAGWRIDQTGSGDDARPRMQAQNELVCGSGYDSMCSTSFLKAGARITLYLSGTNAGYPLIGIETDE